MVIIVAWWLAVCLVSWFVGCFIGWLVGWFVCWLVGWLAGLWWACFALVHASSICFILRLIARSDSLTRFDGLLGLLDRVVM